MIEKPIKVSNDITVGPELEADELDALAKRGFKTVVNLAKKGEYKQSLTPDEEQSVVENAGMHYLHCPLSMSSVKHKHVLEFCESMENVTYPAYIHCNMGQRSGPMGMILHAIRKKLTVEKTFQKATKLGFVWNAPMMRDLIRRSVERNLEALEMQAAG